MLYIEKNAENNYTFDRAGLDAVTMRKTAMGWVIEAVEFSFWDDKKRTTFLWIAGTAREAVKDCLHCLRYIERHNKYKVRA
jgi:hypothetical protein